MVIELKDKKFETFLSKEEIENKIQKLATDLKATISDFSNLVCVCVLNGATPFFNDLIFKLPVDITLDYLKLSSYGNDTKSSGKINLILNNQFDLKGKDVLIIEDIVDSGLTQKFLLQHFKDQGVKSVKICTLFYKSCNNKTDLKPDYFGFEIPDYFILGYGLDYAQAGRNIDHIMKLVE